MKILVFADAHIFDDGTLDDTLAFLRAAVEAHEPDAVVCLGDLFDSEAACRSLGPRFRDAGRALHRRWLFVYGNHDGGTTGGRMIGGWRAFCDVFGQAQAVHDIGGLRFICLGDQQPRTKWRDFALRHAGSGAVVCAHAPLGQALLDDLAARGVRLVLTGHKHVHHRQPSTDGALRQWTLPPARFNGFGLSAAGCALVDVETGAYRWVRNGLPLLRTNPATFDVGAPLPSPHDAAGHFPGEPDAWLGNAPLRDGEREWIGGPNRLQFRDNGRLVWEWRYARQNDHYCTPGLVRHGGRAYLLLGGHWHKRTPESDYESLVVADAATGEECYRVRVIGISQPPTAADGVIYVVGQWREIVAVELATGRELWRRRSQVETPATDGLSWRDGRVGGGWSACPAAVGKHVWVVNARGDLFGYDRATGAERFVHPAAIPLNRSRPCTYAPRLACAPAGYETEATPGGSLVFRFNGRGVEDATGTLLGPRP